MVSKVTGIRFWNRLDSKRKGCDHSGQIQHEILHTIGFYHKHSRIDRDKNLKIYYQSIIPYRKQSFDLVLKNYSNTFGVP
ncbi:Astacin-like metalloendopeptidase [Strongyloides ratti]|uniref:Metalloendopeptidase n=1 Tax=Strongyloides ratti TaxID=34506 RepID=A0A090LR25_STRRB|nr:Astacin-like metalloendopeptidase [Strongyloides ratti]XP_024509830.1 Astacin-like metalloendopeptidase [Strongyloides ratti]CEF70627.1 Astacin-like metalloendopeptidase [Strongyloides ratti]CEF70634.1 Astacin-like metalloendopeptidase [Strongyloides ratti]